jgi:hypothetical protein
MGSADPVAIGFFFAFIALTLGITYWAARRTRTAEHFYAAGRSVTVSLHLHAGEIRQVACFRFRVQPLGC